MSVMSRARAGCLWAVALALLGGCGVPIDDEPRDVQPPRGPWPSFTAPPSVADTPVGSSPERLCFVRDGRLVPVTRRVADSPDIAEQMRDLLAGPVDVERDEGLTTALTGTGALTVLGIADGTARVEIGEPGEGTGRSDDVLAFGQLVCTLTGRREITGVAFVRQGEPVRVPRADGFLSIGPLSAFDYASITLPG
ncbi:GerMN domain-containing protein [Rhizomonospora bruguierae]|uniref:GerMN domain-containing protein n=1 Tax=Rhizomonospora bruguierae TaxID=1581705 RepID=UPI0020C145C7|nr:GerMN domain-containing protein [Micromonospora sp. NBRC 107566]